VVAATAPTAVAAVPPGAIAPTNPGTGAAGAGGGSNQNVVLASLDLLNKQMGQLIAISTAIRDVNDSQLRGIRAMSNDGFMSAG
jgi:hypothetical protein